MKSLLKKPTVVRMISHMENNPEKLKELVNRLPKTEIHIHMEAVHSVKTFKELVKRNNLDIDVEAFVNNLQDPETGILNLSCMIDYFLGFQKAIVKPEDFRLLFGDIKEYMKSQNLFYMETYISPTGFLKNGIDFDEMMDVLADEIEMLESEENRVVRLIPDVSRTFGVQNAERNLDLIIKYKSRPEKGKYIIGIGLGGAEIKGPAKEYKHVFAKAREFGLKLVAHAGEEVGSESIVSALDDLGAMRIGHGTSAKFDPELQERLIRTQIPLEICPTSNVTTRTYVHNYEDHPIRDFFDAGINVTVNSDDPSLFMCNINGEYEKLIDHLNFSLSEILQLSYNSIYATFMSKAKKDGSWRDLKNFVLKEAESY